MYTFYSRICVKVCSDHARVYVQIQIKEEEDMEVAHGPLMTLGHRYGHSVSCNTPPDGKESPVQTQGPK